MTGKAREGENGFAWKNSKDLAVEWNHFNELGLVGFHESTDLGGSKSMTSDELVEMVAVIFYCRQITVHLPEFVILAAYRYENLIKESVPKKYSLLN